jgi:hypothetical protein
VSTESSKRRWGHPKRRSCADNSGLTHDEFRKACVRFMRAFRCCDHPKRASLETACPLRLGLAGSQRASQAQGIRRTPKIMPSPLHPFEDELEQYVLGRVVSPELTEMLEEHLIYCSACQRSVDRISSFVSALRIVVGEGPIVPAKTPETHVEAGCNESR